jgi:hypothetical protein
MRRNRAVEVARDECQDSRVVRIQLRGLSRLKQSGTSVRLWIYTTLRAAYQTIAGTVARFQSLRISARATLASSRGDVPGWVLVTVMTAGLVTALWLIADSEFKVILNRALASIATR